MWYESNDTVNYDSALYCVIMNAQISTRMMSQVKNCRVQKVLAPSPTS